MSHAVLGCIVVGGSASPYCNAPRKVPQNTSSACVLLGVLLAFCSILAFWRSAFGVLPPGVLPWRSGVAWRSALVFWGCPRVLPWRSGPLAFWGWRSGPPGVLPGVLPWRSGGWRSARVLAFCWRSGVLARVLVFWLVL